MKDVYSISISDFPTPNPVTIPGVKYKGRKLLQLKAIFNDDTRNLIRQGGMSVYADHIHDLMNSFSKGVDVTLPVPVVEELQNARSMDDGSVLDYGSIDCHHRIKALLGMNVTQYVFDIYEFTNDTARTLFQLEMNNHYPAKSNTEADIIAVYSNLVKVQKKFRDANDQVDLDALENSLKRTTRYKKTKIDKVIGQILQGSGAMTKNKNYVNDEGERWVYANMPGRVLGSKNGDLWIFKTGTWERTYQRMKRAIFNERSQNIYRVHEIILNVEASLHEDILGSRVKFVDDIRRAFEVDGFLTDGKTDLNTQTKYFRISYAFPQIRDGSEDMNKPVII